MGSREKEREIAEMVEEYTNPMTMDLSQYDRMEIGIFTRAGRHKSVRVCIGPKVPGPKVIIDLSEQQGFDLLNLLEQALIESPKVKREKRRWWKRKKRRGAEVESRKARVLRSDAPTNRFT